MQNLIWSLIYGIFAKKISLQSHIEDIDYKLAAVEEKKRRHDVMAHIHVFSLAAPLAGPIIHWGATSAFVQDNTELIVMRDGIDILTPKVQRITYMYILTLCIMSLRFGNKGVFQIFLIYPKVHRVKLAEA